MQTDYSLKEGEIHGLLFKNRWVHSATHEGAALPDGSCGDEIIELNRKIAAGGAAANIVSFAYIHSTGQCLRGQVGIHSDAMIPGLKKMAEAIKSEGCLAFIQLGHAGCHAISKYTHVQSFGPSEMQNKKGGEARALDKKELPQIAGWFAKAAQRAKTAGFDGIQLHMAHGYLLSSFLSPHYNRREDEYGGSTENRLRFPLEVVRAVRDEVGNDYPVFIKLNSEDGLPDGTTYELMGKYAAAFEKGGIDAIELSGGCSADGALWPSSRGVNPKSSEEESYFRKAAPFFRKQCGLPLILVGGNRSVETGNKMIETGICDYLSISRPLIREPGLINRWRNGDRRRAECLSCNICRDRLFSGEERVLRCPFVK